MTWYLSTGMAFFILILLWLIPPVLVVSTFLSPDYLDDGAGIHF
jgi:hypothetical protein